MFFNFKKLLPKGLFIRFALILITPLILSQFTIGIIFSEKYIQTTLGIISRQMVGEVITVARLLDKHCKKDYIEEIKHGMNLSIEVINNSKLKKKGVSKNHKTYTVLKKALKKRGYESFYICSRNGRMEVYIPSSDNVDIYKISFQKKILYMKIVPLVLGIGAISGIVLLLIAFIFLKNQIRSIKKLASEIGKFGRGIDNNEYKPEGSKEIKIAGLAFCEMKKKFRTLMDTKMESLAGISHDLRTPLTKMKLQLSMMQKTKETNWLMSDVNMMIKMTESFTLHAAEQNREMFTHRNLLSFLKEVLADYTSEKFHAKVDGDESIEVSIKYVSLKRALGNIILNAEKYASNLYINFHKHEKKIIIMFEDDGIGIDEKSSETLFMPFKKQNEARTHENINEGVGLGLSIARNSIMEHGGKIFAKNSEIYGGANFIIEFPIQD
ncbi:MAG: HAMP domain-containing histidine kinase [Holosporales bacterium]|jgi:two-component system osmolarity sensor histidine kinase EnvZ|nr:HAMP domain-containing histidine kinase [Holosporales bacterium]